MPPIEQFNRVVAELRRRFPELRIRTEMDPHPSLAASASVPAQKGLDFGFSLNLQGDELHLNVAGSFWVEWFPCGKDEVTDSFIEAVTGIISGRYRIVEYLLWDAPVKAQLQRPIENGQWEKVATWSSMGAMFPWRRSQNIIQNSGAGPVSLSRGA